MKPLTLVISICAIFAAASFGGLHQRHDEIADAAKCERYGFEHDKNADGRVYCFRSGGSTWVWPDSLGTPFR